MHENAGVLLVVSAVYGWLAWVVYLLLARPARFVEWFMRRPYRSWGITVTVVDDTRLRRRARVLGALLFVVGIANAALVVVALRCR